MTMETDLFVPTEYGKRYTVDMLRAHQIYKNAAGKRVPGVTTMLGILDKPGLLKWAWRMGQEGKDIEKVRDEAAAVGTVAHARVEAYLRHLEFDASGITLERMKQSGYAFDAFVEWWKREGYVVMGSELQMVSERWQCGGTLDILASHPQIGELTLVDIKTSNGLYRDHRLQVVAYAAMYEETHAQHVDRLMLVRIPKEEQGTIEPVEITNRAECEAAFGSLAQTYRLLSKVR